MAKFVMVLSDVTNEQFEKIIIVQTKSEGRLKFVPQNVAAQPTVPGVVGSNALSTVPAPAPHQHTSNYSNVRLEWTHEGIHSAKEILEIFVPKEA